METPIDTTSFITDGAKVLDFEVSVAEKDVGLVAA